VRFLVTADDVIHAWWVPELGWKQDGIPGFINDAWTKVDQPGVYRGQCTELCGKDHGFMPIVVKVVPRSEFEGWLTANGGTLPTEAIAQASEAAPAPPAKG
jgi:cytochrome c oxidase subunit 2